MKYIKYKIQIWKTIIILIIDRRQKKRDVKVYVEIIAKYGTKALQRPRA